MIGNENSKHKSLSSSMLLMRLAESARIWMIVSGVLLVVIVVLSFAIASLFPLKTHVTRYVEFNSSKDVYYKMLPTNELSVDQKVAFLRKAIRKYVSDRNTKDDLTELIRVKELRVQSSKESWEELKKQMKKMLDNMEGVQRQVDIISDSSIQDGIHQVEFRTTDKKDGQLRVRNFVATIGYKVSSDQIVSEENLHLNPLGLLVTKYNVSERKISERQENE